MEFLHRSRRQPPARVAILPGSFNPPTVAHLELGRSARRLVDEVVFVLPQSFPHDKEYTGATLTQRAGLLEAADGEASIATSQGGLYIEIGREFRAHFGPDTRISLLCGRDAAERMLTWDYDRKGVVDELLTEFELLVAPRGGDFLAPGRWRHRIHPLEVSADMNEISSTELRRRIVEGEAWEHLVPEAIRNRVREIYSCSVVSRNARSR